MGSTIYVQIKLASAFVYSPQPNQYQKSTYQQNGLIIRNQIKSLHFPIFQLSTGLLQSILQQENNNLCDNFNKGKPIQVVILQADTIHQGWIEKYSNQNIKLTRLQGNNLVVNFKVEEPLFNFVQKPSPLNAQNKLNLQKQDFLNSLPEQYLYVQLSSNIQIFKVKNGIKQLAYQSNLGEQFHLKIIHRIINKQNKELLQHTLTQIIAKIIANGNHQSTDLLVEDIFGAENCSFIGLPPKIIASSLGKFAKRNKEDQFVIWDSLKSILIAFGINLRQQINKQMLITKIYTAVLKPSQFYSTQFLKLTEGTLRLAGPLLFEGQGALNQFASKLIALNLLK